MKIKIGLFFSALSFSQLFALTDPNSLGNPNYPQVQILPVPPREIKVAVPPKEFPKECRLSALENAGVNPVEILLKDMDENFGFAHYSASVCLTNPIDVDILLDIFDTETSPNSLVKDNFGFWKSYSDAKKELSVMCVVNKVKKFCEVTLNELEQDAVVYHDRTKAIETDFFLPWTSTALNVSEEFDIEFTADALWLKVTHENDNARLRVYFQK